MLPAYRGRASSAIDHGLRGGRRINWEAIGAVGEVLGALGVIVTLVYLALQIRQNSRSVKAAAAQAILQSVTTALQSAIAVPGGGRMARLGLTDASQLDPDEQMQFALWVQSYFRVMDLAYLQFLRGEIDEELWSGYANHLASVARSASIQNYWRTRRSIFSPRFQIYVDAFIADGEGPEFDRVMATLFEDEADS